MRQRLENKLRKSVRKAKHGLPGLSAAIARHQRHSAAFAEALCRLALDPTEERELREFVATLLWNTPAAQNVWLSMLQLAASAGNINVLAAYMSLWQGRKTIQTSDLNVFRTVLASGSLEEQITAVERVAFICRRPVRRALFSVVNDTAAALEVRERAVEMLHVHGHRETAEECARALQDRHASIRFWAAYSLGEMTAFRKSLRE
jgi:hypothetical protein